MGRRWLRDYCVEVLKGVLNKKRTAWQKWRQCYNYYLRRVLEHGSAAIVAVATPAPADLRNPIEVSASIHDERSHRTTPVV